MEKYKSDFITMALDYDALKFGEFKLKSGRVSPYFFNAGVLCTGDALMHLGSAYADAIMQSDVLFDVLFGPAYKGIPLAAITALTLYTEHGQNFGFAYNRKQAKDHGEGGKIVGELSRNVPL